MKNTPLEGKRAVVTGGTRGIGRAIAERLISEGASVLISGTSNKAKDVPAKAEYFAADFSDAKQLAAFCKKVSGFAPDILVNNAGIAAPALFTDTASEAFQRIHHVNVFAAFEIAKAAVVSMKKAGWGRIVNISSTSSRVAPSGRASYASSKCAINGLTISLSTEYAGFGVLTNSVLPGFTMTELALKHWGGEAIKRTSRRIPVGRWARPEEVAALVAWLAGPENTYLTGQNIILDGGLTSALIL